VPKKTPAQTFAAIFARWTSGSTPEERAAGERAADQWLKRRGKTRIDIPAELAQAIADDAAAQPPPPPSDPRDAAPAEPVNPHYVVLDLIRQRVELYLVFDSPHEYVAYTLWAAYTHVYEFYQHAPRLVLTSPTSGCGKSRGLRVLDRLVARPKMSDNFTTATLYDSANDRHTLLVDETDNLDLETDGALRAIFNSGYEKGGMFPRGIGKQRREYKTFVPLALASIGVLTPPGSLHGPLMRRSIIILMRKHRKQRRRFITGDTPDLDALYTHLVSLWAPGVLLNSDPELPNELLRADPSIADNWRPLISVADACSLAWGALARDAAIFFARSGRHEDPVATLLRDIHTVFDGRRIDRITIKMLLAALHDMDGGYWAEFCGVKQKRQPHKLTETELRAMLRPLGIITKSVWPQKGRPDDHSGKGYYRSDFEAIWREYGIGEGGWRNRQTGKCHSLMVGRRRAKRLICRVAGFCTLSGVPAGRRAALGRR